MGLIVMIISVEPDPFSDILPSDAKQLHGDSGHPNENYYENGIPDGVSFH